MGLGLIDGTQPISLFDLTVLGGIPPSATRGLASGYVGTTTANSVAIRATTFAAQGVGAQRSIVSTNANDTGAGTGAQQVTISYLNTSFVLNQETITLNGTTAVNTVNTDIAYIEAMMVTRTGTAGGGNVGTINLLTGIGGAGSIWAQIAASDTQTFYCQHYVPSGVTCYLLGIYGGSQTQGTGIIGITTELTGIFTLNRQQNPSLTNLPQLNVAGSFPMGAGDSLSQKFAPSIPIAGPDFIFITVRPSAAPGAGQTNTAYGTIEYIQF